MEGVLCRCVCFVACVSPKGTESRGAERGSIVIRRSRACSPAPLARPSGRDGRCIPCAHPPRMSISSLRLILGTGVLLGLGFLRVLYAKRTISQRISRYRQNKDSTAFTLMRARAVAPHSTLCAQTTRVVRELLREVCMLAPSLPSARSSCSVFLAKAVNRTCANRHKLRT